MSCKHYDTAHKNATAEQLASNALTKCKCEHCNKTCCLIPTDKSGRCHFYNHLTRANCSSHAAWKSRHSGIAEIVHSATSEARANAVPDSPGASLASGRHEAAAGMRAAAAAAASPGTTMAIAAAAAAAAIRNATRARSGLVTSTERLDTRPANDYDMADALSVMSTEQAKCMLLHTQDYPTGTAALRQVNGPCDWGIAIYGASRNSANTTTGAQGLNFAVASSLLVLARPQLAQTRTPARSRSSAQLRSQVAQTASKRYGKNWWSQRRRRRSTTARAAKRETI